MGYDGIDLRPATVEELAAQERKKVPHPRHRKSSRRPLVVILAALALLAGGAGAFALARTSGIPPELVQPYGSDAPFGVGYVDGFGEHSPKPPPSPTKGKPRSVSSAAGAGSSPSGSPNNILVATNLNAVVWSRVDNGRFDTFVWVHNDGSAPANWEVKVGLPDGAKLTGSTAVNRTLVDATWVFTSTKGSLGAGLVYLFGFSGTTSSPQFSLRSCAVNGSPCELFR